MDANKSGTLDEENLPLRNLNEKEFNIRNKKQENNIVNNIYFSVDFCFSYTET